MKKKILKRRGIVFFIILLILLIILELGSESYFYHKQYDKPLALLLVFKTLIPQSNEYHTILKIREDYRKDNPFIPFRDIKERKFHPFIDWSGAYNIYEYADCSDTLNLNYSNPNRSLDYFGFRNKEDLYFEDKNYTLVVMTGSDEVAGWTHTVTIAENLERILNTRFNNTFKVLNLGMPDYTISNEINSYLHLAYHLKPEFVITHTGFNDLLSGLGVPYNFKRLGLNYHHHMELWLPRLYYLIDYPGYRGLEFVYNPRGSEMIVDNFLRNLDKYRTIVNINEGELIVGIQSWNPHFFDLDTTIYGGVDVLYRDLNKKISRKGYVDWSKNSKLNFIDHVHTDDQSSEIIAEKYAEIIGTYYDT